MGTKDKVLEKVGSQGIIRFAGCAIHVEILDYKNSYGRNRWLVTPVAGSGEFWTEQEPASLIA